MINGTDKYIDTIKYLSKLYDFTNKKLFENALSKPVITVQLDARNRTYGWWSVNKLWHEKAEGGESEHELNITAQELNRSVAKIASTLIHEMCHQYASVNNIQDCSRGNTYHNKLFKKIAENHGLTVKNVGNIGWSHTELTADTEKLIAAFVAENPDTMIYRSPVAKGQTVKTSSTRKYVCPCCQQSVRATKRVNIMCLDCDEPMREDD